MTDQEPSGVDLARVALAQQRAAAPSRPAAAPQQRRPPAATRRRGADGRDPIGAGTAIARFIQDRGWSTATAGGSILDRWGTIAPELAGKVFAEHFDPETGILHLRPHVDAYGTHLRLREREVVDRINEAVGGTTVRGLRILPTGPAAAAGEPAPAAPVTPAPAPAPEPAPGPAAEARAALRARMAEPPPELPPARTRENASEGYKSTRAVYLTSYRRPSA